jgi:hypothetical protein
VPVQRGRVELGQAVDLVDVAVEAVADRDVNEAVVSAQWHSRLGALLGQGVKTRTSTSSQNNCQNSLCGGWVLETSLSSEREEVTLPQKISPLHSG